MTTVRFIVNDAIPTESIDHESVTFALKYIANASEFSNQFIVTNFYELRNALMTFELRLMPSSELSALAKLKNCYILMENSRSSRWDLHYVTDEGDDELITMGLLPRLKDYLDQLKDKSLHEIASNQQEVDGIKKMMSAYIRKQNLWILHMFCRQLKEELSKRLAVEFKQAPACLPIFASNDLEEFVKNVMDAEGKQLSITMRKSKDEIICRIQDDGVGFPLAYLAKDKERKGGSERANINNILFTQHGKFISDKELSSTHGGRGKGLAQTNEKILAVSGRVYVGNASETADGFKHGYVEMSGPILSYRPGDRLFKQMPVEFQVYLCELFEKPLNMAMRSSSPDIELDKHLSFQSRSTPRLFKLNQAEEEENQSAIKSHLFIGK